MLAVIGREMCGWPNIGRKIRLASRTSPENSAEGSTDCKRIFKPFTAQKTHLEAIFFYIFFLIVKFLLNKIWK